MYQIFFTEGEYEPWWFFEDWQSLIIKKIDYPDLNDAKIAYREFTQELLPVLLLVQMAYPALR